MATDKPRYTVSVDDELFQEIEKFRFENRFQSRAEATVDLIQKGLVALKSVGSENKASIDIDKADMIAFEGDSEEPREVAQEEAAALYNQIMGMPPEAFGDMKVIVEFLQWKHQYKK